MKKYLLIQLIMDILTIENLSKRFENTEALKNVSLNVESGAILGLLDPMVPAKLRCSE